MSLTIQWDAVTPKGKALGWLREAWGLLLRDARTSGDAQAYAAVERGESDVRALTEDSDESAVRASAEQYDSLYQHAAGTPALARFLHAAPPLDAAFPLARIAGSSPASAQVDAAPPEGWEGAETLAHSLLPVGDDLRGAVDRWVAEYREALTTPLGLVGFELQRLSRLLAVVQGRLQSTQAVTPAPTPPPVNPQNSTARGRVPLWLLVAGGYLLSRVVRRG